MGLVGKAAQVNEWRGKLQQSCQPWQGALKFRSEGVGVIAPASSGLLPGGRAHTSALTLPPQCHEGQERKANTSADSEVCWAEGSCWGRSVGTLSSGWGFQQPFAAKADLQPLLTELVREDSKLDFFFFFWLLNSLQKILLRQICTATTARNLHPCGPQVFFGECPDVVSRNFKTLLCRKAAELR